jgi:hypothetical protein
MTKLISVFLVVMLGFAILVTSTPARAASLFTVTNTSDSGLGSLRQAIIDANVTGPRLK